MIHPSDLKSRLREEPVFGCFVTFASPAVTEYIAHLGFDFTLLDGEHAAMDSVMIEDMIRASQCAGVPSIVRIPFNRAEHIRKALDSGANGVQVPLVSTAADARAALGPANFPPEGERGVAFLTRAARYGMEPDRASYFERANEAKLVSLHIETPEAVANLDEILEVGGADVYFVGPGDLAVSMGYGREPNHPEVLATMERCVRRIRERGRIAGTLATDVTRSRQVIEWGATYIVTAIQPFVAQGVTQYLRALRKR
jgi:2-keto-3-deoxy-L-rhamnonate aldolase RhmA